MILSVGLGVVVGWFVQQSRPALVNTSSATAYSTPVQITVSERGWSYAVPLDTPWRTAGGQWNVGSRPACLPPTFVSQRITFGRVTFATGGTTDRRVVWVECPQEK